jgi:hypothetical protein
MAEITYGMNQSLMMSNVLSVDYNITGDEIAVAFQDMVQTAVAAGYTPKSNPFYSCPHIGELDDGTYNITVYLPVHEDYLGENELLEVTAYNSYFLVPRMVGARVTGEEAVDFDKAIYLLTNLLIDNDLEESTPVFYISSKINDVLYTDILVGVRDKMN